MQARTELLTRPDVAPQAGQRRGVILLLTAILMVVMFGFIAFSVDYGYMSIVQGGLQNAADSAALAAVVELGDGETHAKTVAGEMALANPVGSHHADTDVPRTQSGVYDRDTGVFTPTAIGANAMRVRTELNNIPLFFAPVLHKKYQTFDASAEAIAMTKPREIVLVVDLSGTMNNDTEVAWAPQRIRGQAASRGIADPNIGEVMADTLYADLNFGSYPGQMEYIGQGVVADRPWAYSLLTNDDGPLRYLSDEHYDIDEKTGEKDRKLKAYRWIIDNQLARLMPNARPYPDSRDSASYDYWAKYLDYVIWHENYWRGYGARQGKTWGRVRIPHQQDADRYGEYSGSYWNPTASIPNGSGGTTNHFNRVGYATYVNYLLDWGRDRSPLHANDRNANPTKGPKVEVSASSPLCRWHDEDVNGETFSFPPRTQPMHACRRSMVRAIQLVKKKNQGVSAGVADRIAVVTFDSLSTWHAPELVIPLTTDYDAAMLACTRLQAVGDRGYSTASQPGMKLAREQMMFQSAGGPARNNSTRVTIFLTDGQPNLYDMSQADIDQYIEDHPHDDWYTGGSHHDYAKNATLIAAAQGQNDGEETFAIGMGLTADNEFMDRMSRMSKTDKAGISTRTSGDPAEYEASITAILEDIIRYAGVSLVK